jgi:hypothetical protein
MNTEMEKALKELHIWAKVLCESEEKAVQERAMKALRRMVKAVDRLNLLRRKTLKRLADLEP